MEKIFFSSINLGLLSKKRGRIHDFLRNDKILPQKYIVRGPKKGVFFSEKMEKIFFSSINVGLLSKKRRRIHDF